MTQPTAEVRPMALRRPRRALVVAVGDGPTSERSAKGIAESLDQLGVEAIYLGTEQDAPRIAAIAAAERADAVEVCLTGTGGVIFLRQLLRELIEIGRRDVSIVVHRAD
jgi:methylmalonyl-CoA mutase cobalamin-binding domain/chain